MKNSNDFKTSTKLKELYGEEYVNKYKRNPSLRLEKLIKFIHLDSNYQVADFACGNGMLMPLVAPKVASYIGVDFSGKFIEDANKTKSILKAENAEFICSEIDEFCANHIEIFDCAFTMDFSEHVPDDQWLEILSNINKSLKKGGSLYLHTVNRNFFIEILKERSIILSQLPEHIAVRTPEENVRLLVKSGYNIKNVLLLPHYDNYLKFIHIFSNIPIFGKYLKARIFIEAVK